MNGSPLLHRRRRQRRERDSPLDPRERPARSADRPARAALLQHGHRHLRLGAHESETARAPRQGPAHRRHRVLEPPAQEPGRQAPRGSVRSQGGDPAATRRLRGTARPARSSRTGRSARSSSAASTRPRTSASARSRSNARSDSISQASPERIARLDDQRAFANLAVSRKKGDAKAKDEEAGRKQQAAIRTLLRSLPDELFLDRTLFEAEFSQAARRARAQACRARPEGDLFRAVRAQQRSADLPGPGGTAPSPTLSFATRRTCPFLRTSSRSSSAR